MNTIKLLPIRASLKIKQIKDAFDVKKLIKKPKSSFIRKQVAKLCRLRFLKPYAIALTTAATVQPILNSEISNYDVEENIAHLMALARIALEKGDTERAEAILDMGLKISDEYRVYVAMPYMYDVLATIALAKGDTAKAENLLVNVIEKLVQIGVSEKDNQIVDFKLRLSRIYSSYRENVFAEIGFKDCLEIQKRKLLDGDQSTRTGILYVNILFWYGLHRLKVGDFIEAKNMIHGAYDYSLKVRGLSPYQEMVILYTMADLNYELGEYEVALQNMQNAIILAKGIGSVDLSRCYVKAARIYFKLGSWDNAREHALEGAKLAKLFNEPDLLVEVNEILAEIPPYVPKKRP